MGKEIDGCFFLLVGGFILWVKSLKEIYYEMSGVLFLFELIVWLQWMFIMETIAKTGK